MMIRYSLKMIPISPDSLYVAPTTQMGDGLTSTETAGFPSGFPCVACSPRCAGGG